MELVERNLGVVSHRVRFGLHGAVLKIPNGNIPAALRGTALGQITFAPIGVNDYDIQVFRDKSETVKGNIQVNQSEGYLHVSDLSVAERNKSRTVNRQEVEESFNSVYPITDEIKTGYLPTGAEGNYYLVTETNGSFILNEVYLFLNSVFNKVSLLDRKELKINKLGGLLNFHSNVIYSYSSLTNTWNNTEQRKSKSDTIVSNGNKVYNIDNQYVLEKVSIEITETFDGVANLELLFNNNSQQKVIFMLDTSAPNELVLGEIYSEEIMEEIITNGYLEVVTNGTNTTGKFNIKFNYTGRP